MLSTGLTYGTFLYVVPHNTATDPYQRGAPSRCGAQFDKIGQTGLKPALYNSTVKQRRLSWVAEWKDVMTSIQQAIKDDLFLQLITMSIKMIFDLTKTYLFLNLN